MEAAGKIAALAIVSAVLCVLIRENQKPVSILLSLFGCIGLILIGFAFFEPVIAVLDKLADLSGVEDEIVAPMLKVAGVGLLTQISAGICTDAGEGALAKSVELVGTVLAMYASLPLILAVLELVEKMMGGLG